MAQHSVAIRTEQSARLTRDVIVVNGKSFGSSVGTSTYSAVAILRPFHLFVEIFAHAVCLLNVGVVRAFRLCLFEFAVACGATRAGVRQLS